MEFFITLDDAKAYGKRLAKERFYPTIYETGTGEYVVLEKGEWPLRDSWPVLKWTGRREEWVPVLIKLSSKNRAKNACGLFWLLGHAPFLVEFPGITFDLYLRREDIPLGATITGKSK